MPKPLSESTTLLEATAGTDAESGLLEVEFITPGWGSSGYYSRQVVEAAAPLFAVGTHMYFDHPSASEASDRPERSVRDLAAVIVEAGVVNKTTGGVRGKVKPLAPYRELLTDEAFATNVGLSIRGSATDIVVGEAEGRSGPIVEGLAEISSVDFVTRAGRGGRVLAVLESERFIAEATSSDRARQLSDAVQRMHQGLGTYCYVTDHDGEKQLVWFIVSYEGPDRARTFEQGYEVADNDAAVTLVGEPVEVTRLTTYVPVNTDPAGRTTTPTEETQEVTMGNIQVDEAEHRRVTEAAGRVPTLESERDTANQRADAAEAKLAERDRKDRAADILAEKAKVAGVTFTALECKGLLAELPVTEGNLDETTFGATVDTAVTEATAARGTGSTVRGFGESTTVTESTGTTPATTPWGRPLATVKGA